MRKTFAIIIAILLFLIIIIILLPHILKRSNEVKDDNAEISCKFNFNEISSELQACLDKTSGKNLSMTINNVVLSETEKTIKIIYNNVNNTLELYFDDNLIFSEEKINKAKRIQDIVIFKNETLIFAFYTQSEINHDTSNAIAFDDDGNIIFQLKEDDSYYSISNIDSKENKISFSKYNYVDNELLKENYETTYLGETIFSDYNLIENQITN